MRTTTANQRSPTNTSGRSIVRRSLNVLQVFWLSAEWRDRWADDDVCRWKSNMPITKQAVKFLIAAPHSFAPEQVVTNRDRGRQIGKPNRSKWVSPLMSGRPSKKRRATRRQMDRFALKSYPDAG